MSCEPAFVEPCRSYKLSRVAASADHTSVALKAVKLRGGGACLVLPCDMDKSCCHSAQAAHVFRPEVMFSVIVTAEGHWVTPVRLTDSLFLSDALSVNVTMTLLLC